MDSYTGQHVGEHLLVCTACQDRLEELEQFIRATKIALQDGGRKPAARAFHVRSWVLAPVFTVLLAVTAGLVFNTRQPATAIATTEVRLFAMRGDGASMGQAHAGRRLILDLDATGLPAAGDYMVRAVDSGGREFWAGSAAGGNPVRVRVDRPLPKGQYWVRLYTGSDLKREYGLNID